MLEAGLLFMVYSFTANALETRLGALIRPNKSHDFQQKRVIGLVWIHMG